MTSDLTTSRHQITRVRRETRRRLLTVVATRHLTPQMLRIDFTSPDLHDFDSAAPDDHIKLFVGSPNADEDICMRDYTPRKFDAGAGKLTLDFALHDAGPATAWALAARPGDTVEIGGPRGSSIVSDTFDWYLLIGDETALPAIGRRLEELRPGVPVTTIAVTETPTDRQTIDTRADWTARWIAREGQALDDGDLLTRALADYQAPAGDGYIWIAAEALAARSVRALVTDGWGHPKEWVKSAGYWMRGEPGAHE